MAELQPQAGSIEAHALARHVRMSPQKARLVMDLIRGQKAQAALQTLRFTPKRAAKHIEKVLRSAIANAERKAEGACVPRPWAARSATRNAPRICGLALPSITWPPRSALPPSKRKRKRKRACAVPRAACAKLSAAGKAVQRRARSKETNGTENAPLRIPPRLQQAVEVALVRRPRLRRAIARRREAAPRAERAPQERGHQLYRYRARGQQARRAHLHRASGDHHRAQRSGNRQAQAGSAEAHQARSAHRHSRSTPPGAGRAARRRIHRAAARKARGVSPCDAQSGGLRAALRL